MLTVPPSFARRAAETGDEAGNDGLKLFGLLTMRGSLAIASRMSEALEVVEDGVATAPDPHLRARFAFQRAAILANAGNATEAVDSFRQVRAMVDPVLIAQGLRMFPDPSVLQNLRLTDCIAYDSGVALLIYQRRDD